MLFLAILSNYNGTTTYICPRFIPTTAFLVRYYFCKLPLQHWIYERASSPQPYQSQLAWLLLVATLLLKLVEALTASLSVDCRCERRNALRQQIVLCRQP